jgi:hypothetical protein
MLLHLFIAQKQYTGHQIFKTDVGTAMKQWLQEKENYFFEQETGKTYPNICALSQSPRELKEKQFTCDVTYVVI